MALSRARIPTSPRVCKMGHYFRQRQGRGSKGVRSGCSAQSTHLLLDHLLSYCSCSSSLRSTKMNIARLLLLALNVSLLVSSAYGIKCYLDINTKYGHVTGERQCDVNFCLFATDGKEKAQGCAHEETCTKAGYVEGGLVLPSGALGIGGCCAGDMCNTDFQRFQESLNTGVMLPVVTLSSLFAAFVQFFMW
uniref:Activin_recp domain-containing protein n=1 Tax=Steinernema glaseri TaxID=37863 RepID=A0A1I8AU51_9BILA